MNELQVEKFRKYLTEVIEYYHANGNLKKFSTLSKKHKVSPIPMELFFKYKLNEMPRGSSPSVKTCNVILDDLRNRNKKVDAVPQSKLSVFIHPNGEKTIVRMSDDVFNFFNVALNYKGRADERGRIWTNDIIDNLMDNCKVVATTIDDYTTLIDALAREVVSDNMNFYTEEDLVSFGNYLLSDKRNDKIDSKSASKMVGDWDLENWKEHGKVGD